jgi:phosphoribosylanthranilate isomerase
VSLWVKICGVTSLEDALMVERSGADAIGLNFVPQSPRCISAEKAREITDALRDQIEFVGVFVDMPLADVIATVDAGGIDTVQLHGGESPEMLGQLSEDVPAYKALRIGGPEDVALATSYSGDRILVDAKVEGAMGGTGQTFDWSLIEELNTERKLILAGGLNPENVATSVREVQPYGVDTASGVESAPGVKDEALVTQFIALARKGFRG